MAEALISFRDGGNPREPGTQEMMGALCLAQGLTDLDALAKVAIGWVNAMNGRRHG